MYTTYMDTQVSNPQHEYRLPTSAFFEEGGLISSIKPDFKPRAGQAELSELILRAAEEHTHVVAEAPTGFGKSFAVLAPAITNAIETHKRTVVSTETLTLQDQYVGSDLPMLQRACAERGFKFTYAVAKGRTNYVCRLKLDEEEFTDSSELMRWAKTQDPMSGHTGDQSSVPFAFNPKDWNCVCADEDCEKKACPYYGEGRNGHSECFVSIAQQRYMTADIVVSNHTLVLLDLEVGAGTLLGAYDWLLVDEGHSFSEKAKDTWGVSFKPRTVTRALSLIVRMLSKVGVHAFAEGYADHYRTLEEHMFKPLYKGLKTNIALKQLDPNIIAASKDGAAILLEELKQLNKDLTGHISSDEGSPRTMVIRAAKERVTKLCRDLAAVYGDTLDDAYKDNWLVFLEVGYNSRREPYPILNLKPIEVGPLMHMYLFGTVPFVLFMSATMRIGTSFAFMRRELALPKETQEFIGESPFDFENNVTGYFPRHLPDSWKNEHEYLPALAAEITEVIKHAKGRTLVLFTNNSHMINCFNAVTSEVPYTCYIQGEAAKALLIERFTSEIASCLFASRSFFSGVDFPGETCSCVVMTKAPFEVPTEPMFKARADKIDDEGGSSFADLSMPLMLFQIRQAFGRLIRSVNDSGLFAMLDSRALNKSYGKNIIAALPKMKTVTTLGEPNPSRTPVKTSAYLDLEED